MKTNKTFAYGSGMDAAVTNIDWSLRSKLRGLKSSRMMILILIIVLGILFPSACKNEPETITVEKDVTVSFPAFESGKPLNLTPTYGDWGEHFSTSDITYTVTDNKGNEWNSTTGYIIDASVAGYGYTQPETITFTQTYTMNGVVIASQSFYAAISLFGAKQFSTLQNTDGVIQTIPSITLHLEKTVTK